MLESALKAFDQKRQAYLADLMTFLRFETISAQSIHADDMRRCTEWIRGQLDLAGIEARVVPTARHPAVLGDSGPVPGRPSATTLLVYGHYDVQPVGDLRLWKSPPFEPAIRDQTIFARGSADDKGQIMTHLAAMRAWKETREPLPVRVKFLIEGEEEIGSAHLPDLVRERADELACDYVVLSDTSTYDHDTPAMDYATRGLVYKEIIVDGPARDLHSGQYGGTVANPANVLAGILASLHDGNGRVTIPGFYDDVRPLSSDERQALAQHGMSDTQLLAATGSPAPFGEPGFTTTERYGARPTLDVNGLVSGYIDEGAATILPSRAASKVSMRLVGDQDPDKISKAFDAAVRMACPATVRLTILEHSNCAAYLAPTDSPGMKAAIAALTETYGKPPILTRGGGTLPILPMFRKILGADSIMLGFSSPDCNVHSPNEFFHLHEFETGTRCVLRFLSLMGGVHS
ncbi:MAG TPA: dipeptidase [Phycisphaerae bacterium]|nr:dipeptidase [Phycisphaerae bacterium]HRY67235.1 dipeptidase [Phycisphaerae bacterium]HSA26395.1 dipeptidase [Phycisphaerae bacterium]